MFIFNVFFSCMLGSYFSDFNSIGNQNRMCQSDLFTEKYLVTQIGYFRLADVVDFGMEII